MDHSVLLNSTIRSPVQVSQLSTPPVIIVGLPRSGSSYLTHILSSMKGLFVFDDLYPYQHARSLGISNELNLQKHPNLKQKFVESLTWQLRAKITFEQHFHISNITIEDTYDLEKALAQALNAEVVTWTDILQEWTKRLAYFYGKKNWGYKTPQDFLHLEELSHIFPGVRFICVLRDPRKMMLSYKNLPKVQTAEAQDGESRAYHPIFYSLYWKKAFEKVSAFKATHKDSIYMVRFEDLISSPESVSKEIAEFLSTTIEGNIAFEKGNSSTKSGRYSTLTKLELFLCEKIAGSSMKKAGYSLSQSNFSVSGFWDFIRTTIQFFCYQSMRFITDRRARVSIKNFALSFFSKG